MERSDVERWVLSGESETQEFKKSVAEVRSASQTLCAMLNHRGGRVLFGIERSGRVLGQHVGEQTIERIAQEVGEIDPTAFPAIDRINVGEEREVLIVTVTQGPNRPYSYRGKAYHRLGNTNIIISRDEYNRMLVERLHGEQRWENQVAAEWKLADLDVIEITRTMEEAIRRGRADDPGSREPEMILRGLGLMKEGQLLQAAIVLFGKNEKIEENVPQCLLRVARFRGRDKTEFLDNRQFHGNAFELLLRAERFLRENLPIAGRVLPGSFERVDEPLYPPVALREALANAICHRDYSFGGGSISIGIYDDRLEITSSGVLHFGLTAEALFQPHDSLPWNPLIARVFYRRGIIESWGRGTLQIAELTQRAGLPRPDIEEVAGSVTVRFKPSKYLPPRRVAHTLSDRQQAILALLNGKNEGAALRSIRQLLHPPSQEWEVKSDLATLKALGLVVAIGRGRGAVWFLVDGEANSNSLQFTPIHSNSGQKPGKA